MKKIQKGDQVKVMRGKLKGKVSKVQKVKKKIVNGKLQCYVYLEGLNVHRKVVKPNPALGIKGGFRDIFLPVHISNVMLYNSDTNQVVKKRKNLLNNEENSKKENQIARSKTSIKKK